MSSFAMINELTRQRQKQTRLNDSAGNRLRQETNIEMNFKNSTLLWQTGGSSPYSRLPGFLVNGLEIGWIESIYRPAGEYFTTKNRKSVLHEGHKGFYNSALNAFWTGFRGVCCGVA
jgi:hypothetical protein